MIDVDLKLSSVDMSDYSAEDSQRIIAVIAEQRDDSNALDIFKRLNEWQPRGEQAYRNHIGRYREYYYYAVQEHVRKYFPDEDPRSNFPGFVSCLDGLFHSAEVDTQYPRIAGSRNLQKSSN